jgi:predicted AlkP superfamily phosphohydrolase/phosphomutase
LKKSPIRRPTPHSRGARASRPAATFFAAGWCLLLWSAHFNGAIPARESGDPGGAGLCDHESGALSGAGLCARESGALSGAGLCARESAHLEPPDPGISLAYIGPGAGIALIGSFMAVAAALASAFLAMLSWPIRRIWRMFRGQKAYKAALVKRVVVVGLDGLEPTLTEELLEEGILPNLAKLKQDGTYMRLGTTWPPLSPVAWSSFATGTNPGKHNIFDFISRNPADYRPTMSSVRIREPKRKLKLGGLLIPISKPELTGLRKSKPFWTVLGEAGIFSAVLRVPITFPPDRFKGVQLSAMCVPDLRGTQGMFTFYSEQGQAGTTGDGDTGGDRIIAQRRGDAVESYVRGPINSLRVDRAELRLPFSVRKGRDGAAVMTIGGQRINLPLGRHTEWIRISFKAAPGIKVRGVCQFFLRQFEPFELYCTPVQIDPDKPVMPISHPVIYSSYLARSQGTFATLGLAEDTWSLSEKLMGEDGFLEQAYEIHDERETMFFDTLERVRQGLVVCVFDGPDRIQHMFWRFIDDRHPALRPEQRASHRNVIRDMYKRMDELIGRVRAKLDSDTALMVMSDHGFKPFRRGVELNAWLLANGYLKLKNGATSSNAAYLADIDWSATRAYAIGLAGIFLNQKGREAQGIVEPGEAKKLIDELCNRLTGLRDPHNDEIAIHQAISKHDAYKGPYKDAAPDLIIGYNVGYRVSWDAATGKTPADIFTDNMKAWSGDHCIHPDLVPGVLFSDLMLDPKGASIMDVAPTALELFGLPRPAYMDGRSLLLDEKGDEDKAAPAAIAAAAVTA